MVSQVVRPSGARHEGLYLAVTAGVILLAWAVLVGQRHVVPAKTMLSDSQVTAFSLNPVEQGLFNDLYATAAEIDGMHKDNVGAWLSIDDLTDLVMPPFPQDAMWEGRGRHVWIRLSIDYAGGHASLYLGKSASPEDVRSFALVMAHRHPAMPPSKETRDPPREKAEGAAAGAGPAFFTIWVHPTADTPFPALPKLAELAAAGWKEVIPVRGSADSQKSETK